MLKLSNVSLTPEFWLRGPVEGIPALLMPVAHALLQSRQDLRRAAETLTSTELWDRPGGAAAVGFHLRHISGSVDRLFTYARGQPLRDEQLIALREEGDPGSPPASAQELLALVDMMLDDVVRSLHEFSDEQLLMPRAVGRARLPSNVLGLLFHAAEHAQRHTGQVITTSKIIRGLARELTTESEPARAP
jgi:uncharacterized damage-inducible protein DinB